MMLTLTPRQGLLAAAATGAMAACPSSAQAQPKPKRKALSLPTLLSTQRLRRSPVVTAAAPAVAAVQSKEPWAVRRAIGAINGTGPRYGIWKMNIDDVPGPSDTLSGLCAPGYELGKLKLHEVGDYLEHQGGHELDHDDRVKGGRTDASPEVKSGWADPNSTKWKEGGKKAQASGNAHVFSQADASKGGKEAQRRGTGHKLTPADASKGSSKGSSKGGLATKRSGLPLGIKFRAGKYYAQIDYSPAEEARIGKSTWYSPRTMHQHVAEQARADEIRALRG